MIMIMINISTQVFVNEHTRAHTHTCIHAYIKPRWLILLPKLYGDQQRALSLEYESMMVSIDSPNCWKWAEMHASYALVYTVHMLAFPRTGVSDVLLFV